MLSSGRARRVVLTHLTPPKLAGVIIQHAVWLYLRFTLSYRDVEELRRAGARDLLRNRPVLGAEIARLAEPRLGVFWRLGDPAWISLPGPAWLCAR